MVAEHKKQKSGFATKIALNAADMGKQMKHVAARWKDDASWMSWMNIHALFIIIAGDPDTAASKHNTIVYGTPAVRKWAEAELPVKSSLLPKIHSYIVVHQGQTGIRPRDAPKTMPPNMHGTRAACTTEIMRLLDEQSGVSVGARFPWGTLPNYLMRHRLRIDNWPGKDEFPDILDFNVSRVRTDQWANMWKRLFAVADEQRFRVSKLDVPADDELSPITVLVDDSNHRLLMVADVTHNKDPEKTPGKRSAEHVEDDGTEENPGKKKKKDVAAKDRAGKGGKRRRKKDVLSKPLVDEDRDSVEVSHALLAPVSPSTISPPMLGLVPIPSTAQLDMYQNPATASSSNLPPPDLGLGDFDVSQVDVDFSQFPDLDMSQNQDLLLGGPSVSLF